MKKLPRLNFENTSRFDYRGHPSTFKNARCNCCNKVSHSEVASDTGEHTQASFFVDPHKSGYLCGECYGSYADSMTEYDFWDDEDDLMEDFDND